MAKAFKYLSILLPSSRRWSTSLQRADETLDLSRTNRLRFLKPWSCSSSPKAATFEGYREHMSVTWSGDIRTPEVNKSFRVESFQPFPYHMPRNPCQIYPFALPTYCGNWVVAETTIFLKILCNFITVNFQLRDFHHLKDAATSTA